MVGRKLCCSISLLDQMATKLQSTSKQLEMEMKRFVVDQRYVWITAIMNRLYQRPSPEELKELLPNVYDSLSEEVKENGKGKEVTALFRVHASLLMATAEQMMIIGKVEEIV